MFLHAQLIKFQIDCRHNLLNPSGAIVQSGFYLQAVLLNHKGSQLPKVQMFH